MNTIKVAGVTFNNSDGESRQEILKQMGFGYRTALLKQTTFENERAVEVWIDGKMIGYVPRINLSDSISYASALTARLMYFEEKDIYHVELSVPERPSPEEYQTVQTYCAAKKIPLPYFDKKAYALFAYENPGFDYHPKS